MQSMKQKIFYVWQNAERLLIIVFLASFTLNIRKVFLTPYSFLKGGFNEYTTISLNWADALMIAVIVIYTIKYVISQLNKILHLNLTQYNNNTIVSTISTYGLVSYETILLIMFLTWAGLSIIWSVYKPIAIYRLATLLEITIFVVIAIKSLKNKKWFSLALFALIINGIFQSTIGITQFIHNGSIRLHILGESLLGPNIDGVAKIMINGEKHIRAYGTLPHPNILAGFLIVPLFLIIGEIINRFTLTPKRSGRELKDERLKTQSVSTKCSGCWPVVCGFVSHETFLSEIPNWFLRLALLIIEAGFLVTFSRSAFLGIFIGLMFLFCKFGVRYWRSFWTNKRSVNIFRFSVALMFILILLYIFGKNTSFFSSQSLEERNLYNNVSYETILAHPIMGTGLGQFIFNEYKNYQNLESWQYQPVHNIYLLVSSELGIIGFILILLFWVIFLQRDRGRKSDQIYLTLYIIYSIMISFVVISFFDHYFWDIKIGTIIFVLPILFFIVASKIQENSL